MGYNTYIEKKQVSEIRKGVLMKTTTYTEIRRLTGNNKGYAEAALNVLVETCDWITGSEDNIVYLRNNQNDWVAILDVYADEGTEFTTVRGNSVVLTDGGLDGYSAMVAE